MALESAHTQAAKFRQGFDSRLLQRSEQSVCMVCVCVCVVMTCAGGLRVS